MEPTSFIKPATGEPLPSPEKEVTIEKNTNENTVKLFAGVGIVAVVALAAWVGVRAVSLVSDGSLANVFSGLVREKITLTLEPRVIVTGESAIVSFEHTGRDADGSYTFSYACSDDYSLTTSLSEDSACDTPFPLTADENSFEIIATSRSTSTVSIPLSVGFTLTGDDEPSIVGNDTLSVVRTEEEIAGVNTDTPNGTEPDTNGGAPVTPARPPIPPGTETTDTIIIPGPGPRVSDPNGDIDLAISLIAYGELNGKRFTEKSPVDPDERVGIRFAVTNRGTKASGNWEFEAKLPTEPSYTYDSPRQQTLFPGERIEFTLGFDRVEDDEETGIARIEIDPDRDLDDEKVRNNNTLSVTIRFDVDADDDDDEDFEISNIDVEIDNDEITITWETDVRASSKVYWSTDKDFDLDDADGDEEDNDLTRKHEIVIDADDLDEDTRYYFVIESEDDDGNVERSDEKSFRTE